MVDDNLDWREARRRERAQRWQQRGTCRCGGGLFGPVLLIALGLVFLAMEFNYMSPDRAWGFFWPFILVFCGVRMLANRGRAWLGICAIALGVALAGDPLNLWYFDIGRFWPLILIGVGISMMFGRGYVSGWRPVVIHGNGGPTDLGGDGSAAVNGTAMLGGFQSRVTSQNFTGGRLTACFGGFQVDLRRAGMSGDVATIAVDALFGGGEIRVPEEWIIDIQGEGIFGAFTDETRQQVPTPGAKRLVVRGSAIFGGVVVKN